MGNGVTIIVGAGAVLDFDHKGLFPSVNNITDEVLKLNIQKVDVMQDGVVLAASLKDAPEDSPVVSAVKDWEAYANDNVIYNDIRLPWFIKS